MAAASDATMVTGGASTAPPWATWQRVAFRLAFCFFLLHAGPWSWFAAIPGVGALSGVIGRGIDWAVRTGNDRLFHVREVLVVPNGSGDTSWGWARLWLFLTVSLVVGVVWSVVDRRGARDRQLLYWFRTILRYYLALFALSYGIIKLFLLQMGFPTTSQMITPLGDFLPMRLSWMFIGYSAPYQFFSGAVETLAGLLLLWRPTVTLGLFTAVGAFVNVFMINIAYDVPVKLFSGQLMLTSMVLLGLDAPRLLRFLVLNRAVEGTRAWDPPFAGRGAHVARRLVKAAFVVVAFVLPMWRGWEGFRRSRAPVVAVPLAVGLHDVRLFVRGRDTIPVTPADTLRWRDVAIDGAASGSVGSTDPAFWQRYRRGYFRFRADTVAHTLAVWRTSWTFDSTHLFTARYDQPDSATVRLWTSFQGESLHVELVRSRRHFQLSERQFHWLSEYNR